MTHTTDQERAEFEKWWSSPHIWGRGHKEAQWASWQAARRAPVVPVISEAQVLAITTAYEQGVGKGHQSHARKEAITNPYGDEWGCDSAWQMGYDEGREQAERKAAPQPPEADMGIPISASAPVQLPEPVAQLWQHGETGRTRVLMPDAVTDCDAQWKMVAPLYTEQQVRQLLAAHGMQGQST